MSRWIRVLLVLAATPVVWGLLASIVAAAPAWSSTAPGGLPPEVRVYFTPVEFARGQAYTGGRCWLAAAGIALRLGGLLLLACTPASAALRRLALRWSRGRLVVATAFYLLVLGLGYAPLTLPLRYYAGVV